MARSRSGLVSICAFWLSVSTAGAESFREEFDQAGGGAVAPTRFSVLVLNVNGGIERAPLAPGLGVPSTGGVLPVDEAGDSELRFFEAVVGAGSSFVLTPESSYTDVAIDAYFCLARTTTFGTIDGTLLARATGSTIQTQNAYGATFLQSRSSDALLVLGRVRNGVIQTLVSSDLIPVDLDAENYRVFLRAVGSKISASVSRVESIGGIRVEKPIDLDIDALGVQAELTAVDAELTSGALGLRAFSRSTNSMVFDDVTVDDIVFLDDFESGDTSAWSIVVP